jgi:urease beta subunit
MTPNRIEGEDLSLTNSYLESGKSPASGDELITLDEVAHIEFAEVAYSIQEGDTGVPNRAAITLTRSGNLSDYAEVEVKVAGGSATRGWDFDFPDPFVRFQPGQTTQTFFVDIWDDPEIEGTEAVNFELMGLGNSVVGAQNATTLSIIDDEVANIEFAAANYSVSEADAGTLNQVAITLTRSGNIFEDAEVEVNVTGGSATRGWDFDFPDNRVRFVSGQTIQTFFVDIWDDPEIEGTETVNFELVGLGNSVVGAQNTTTLSIVDDEVANIEFAEAAYSIQEGDTSVPNQVAITLTRSGNLSDYAEVEVNVTGGSATRGWDFDFPDPFVRFEPGQTTQTFFVDIWDDPEIEGTETVNFELMGSGNSVVGEQNTTTLSIIDDEVANIEFAAAHYSADEAGTGTLNQVAITLTRSGNIFEDAEVEVNVTGGSATRGWDFDFPDNRVRFVSGQTIQTFFVDIWDDPEIEGTETVNFELMGLGNSAVGEQNTTTLSIVDDEAATIEFAATNHLVSEGGGSYPHLASLTLTRSGNLSDYAEVEVQVTGGSATQGWDFDFPDPLVRFEPGQTTQTFSVDVWGDAEAEGTEFVNFKLQGYGSSFAGSQDTATLIIADDEVLPLMGSDGDDVLTGDAGANIIDGGNGDDLLTGGAGRDIFVVAEGRGTDTITDFEVGQDLIGLAGGLSFEQLFITQGTGAGNNTSIAPIQGGEPLAILSGISASAIAADTFVVV